MLFVFVGGILLYNRGRISEHEWESISRGMSKETVIEYVGSPSSKTINSSEITNSYHSYLFSSAYDSTGELEKGLESLGIDTNELIELSAYQENDYYNVEMYTYIVNGKEKKVYFVDDSVFTKI